MAACAKAPAGRAPRPAARSGRRTVGAVAYDPYPVTGHHSGRGEREQAGQVRVRDRGRRLVAGEGHHRGVARAASEGAGPSGLAPEVRPLHQRRPRDDEPVPARRGLRDRGRRRDRPRPRPLRALRRRVPVAELEPHDRLGLQRDHPPRAQGRVPRLDRAGDPARHRRDQAPRHAGRRLVRRRRGHHRDRRHGGRHREPAVPRGAAPVPKPGRPRQRHVHPLHARAVHRRGGRAQDQADAALRPGAAPHRYLAGCRRLPIEAAALARHPREDRALRRRAGRRRHLGAGCREHLRDPAHDAGRGARPARMRPARPRHRPSGHARVGDDGRPDQVGRRQRPDRPGRQVRPAPGRLPVGRRGPEPRGHPPRHPARGRLGRRRDALGRGGRAATGAGRRHPHPRRLRDPRDRGQDRSRPVRPREQRAVPGDLPRDAGGRRRVRPDDRRARRSQLERVRPRDALPRDRPPPRAEGRVGHGRDDAARLRPGQARRRLAGARRLRRVGGVRAAPAPIRGEQQPPPAARRRGPRRLGHVARRAAGRDHRAARPSMVLREPVPPGVQVAAQPAAAALPRLRRSGGRAHRRRATRPRSRPRTSRRERRVVADTRGSHARAGGPVADVRAPLVGPADDDAAARGRGPGAAPRRRSG